MLHETRNKKLLGAPGIATRSKDATRRGSHGGWSGVDCRNAGFCGGGDMQALANAEQLLKTKTTKNFRPMSPVALTPIF